MEGSNTALLNGHNGHKLTTREELVTQNKTAIADEQLQVIPAEEETTPPEPSPRKRIPVKITFDSESIKGHESRITPGMSAEVSVELK